MLNTNYKRYNFYGFLSCGFLMFCMVQVGVFSVTSNRINALIGCIEFLLSVICAIQYSKYFNKTYQLKKNANKEINKK